jgi:outer membrane protein assembly factor BamB
LWNRSVKDLWLKYTYSSEGTAQFNSLVRFSLLPSPDRLLLLHNNTLFCLNVADGQDAQAPIPLSFTPALAPVLTSRKDTALILENQTNSLILHALDLAKGSDKWSHPFRPPNSSDPIGADHTRWFQLVDLDHDGQDQVVLTSVPSPRAGNSLDLEVIQAATGSLKWHVQISGPLQGRVRTLAGPDLNHDRSAELFIALA